MGSIVFLVLLLGIMYFIMIRPQQKRMREHAALLRSLEPGMVVVTASGIHGAVAEVEDNVVWLEVAPEVELKISKAAITEVVPDDEDDDEEAEATAAADDES